MNLITTVELSGDESDEQCKQLAWEMFCIAHPFAAHLHDPEAFWNFFHVRCPDITRERMVEILKDCEETSDRGNIT